MLATMTLKPEALPIIRSSLDMKRRSLETSLRRYGMRLTDLEVRFAMTSQDFARRFNAGELGDDAVWFEWDYLLDAHQETMRQLELIRTISL